VGGVTWEVVLLDEVDEWFMDPVESDPDSAALVGYHHMKELRPGSSGRSEIRILFAFDPAQQAVLLVAGDKSGNWQGWYRENLKVADDRYVEWLAGARGDEKR
jgi:hypothetical protein